MDIFEKEDQKQDFSKEVAEYKNKLDQLSNAYSKEKLSWEEERKNLESGYSRTKQELDVAKDFERLIKENPTEAIYRITEFHKKASQAKENPLTDILAPISKKLESIEKSLLENKEKEYVSQMEDSIIDSVSELKDSYGIEADPKYIIKYMKDNELYSPRQVPLAVKNLYLNEIIGRANKPNKEAVVLGSQGYTQSEEERETEKLSSIKENIDDNVFWEKLENIL